MNKPLVRYRDNTTNIANNNREKLTIEELPNNANGAKTRELIPYTANANANTSKQNIPVNKTFSSRRNISAIGNNDSSREKRENASEKSDSESDDAKNERKTNNAIQINIVKYPEGFKTINKLEMMEFFRNLQIKYSKNKEQSINDANKENADTANEIKTITAISEPNDRRETTT